MAGYSIAVVGATGMVGSTTLSILEERQFPIEKIYLIASHRSAGDTREFNGKSYYIEDLKNFDFNQTQIIGTKQCAKTSHDFAKTFQLICF